MNKLADDLKAVAQELGNFSASTFCTFPRISCKHSTAYVAESKITIDPRISKLITPLTKYNEKSLKTIRTSIVDGHMCGKLWSSLLLGTRERERAGGEDR